MRRRCFRRRRSGIRSGMRRGRNMSGRRSGARVGTRWGRWSGSLLRGGTHSIWRVTEDGWPYVQHRGGPKGFLRVLDGKTLAFADFSGNKQYITAGNLATNDRVALFLMDYPNQARLKIIGHAKVVEGDKELEAKVRVAGYPAKVDWVMVVEVVGFDWNCSQHI